MKKRGEAQYRIKIKVEIRNGHKKHRRTKTPYGAQNFGQKCEQEKNGLNGIHDGAGLDIVQGMVFEPVRGGQRVLYWIDLTAYWSGTLCFMEEEAIEVIKKSGEKVRFSKEKLQNSLRRSGADAQTVDHIIERVREDLYQGISTKEIYKKAFALLLKKERHYAAKYHLKKAIYELGPTGFPFESFIGALLDASGFRTHVGVVVPGTCVDHEVDVVAQRGPEFTLVECKFHSEEGFNCNVKIPLYIHARYNDIRAHWEKKHPAPSQLNPVWVVTNTRFTADAQRYGTCAGLYLVSWDAPEGDSLKARIDRSGLYPVTVSTLLSKAEKQALLDRKMVLCTQVLAETRVLQDLGITEARAQKIRNEMNQLCAQYRDEERS